MSIFLTSSVFEMNHLNSRMGSINHRISKVEMVVFFFFFFFFTVVGKYASGGQSSRGKVSLPINVSVML
jgi:phosphate starvation-inducible membrane PsiE